MLRFNGQSPTSANGAFSAFPGRNYGTVSGIALQTGMIPLWKAGRAQTGAFGEFAGQPDGTLHPVSWLMGLYPGRISSRNIGATFTLDDLAVVSGKNAVGSTDITFTVGPSQLNLVVSAVGNADITFTLTGLLQSVAPASGNADINFTVGPATLGALAGVFGNVTVTIAADGTIRAIGNLSGAITPYTELSPQNLAAAVWEALASAYNAPGSMGEKLNDAGSAANPWTEVIDGTYTASDLLKLMAASAAGELAGSPGGPILIKSVNGSTVRITATVDANGNRTGVTYDVS
jgi:hypothetical protein